MSVTGVQNGQTSYSSKYGVAGFLEQKAKVVQKVASLVFEALKDSFRKAFTLSITTIPIQAAFALIFPVNGVLLTFVAIHVATLATFTVAFSVYKLCKKNSLHNQSGGQSPQTGSGFLGFLSQAAGQVKKSVQGGQKTEPAKPQEPESPQFSGESILIDSNGLPKIGLKIADKFYKQLEQKEFPRFTPLSEGDVRALLKMEPSLRTHRVARNTMNADDSILSIQRQGIPSKLSGDKFRLANENLRDQMRYNLYRINQEPSLVKKQELLKELANGLEDCVPNTQRSVDNMFQKLSSIGAFETQLDCFITRAKEAALDESIYELFPAMQKPSYASWNLPHMQFPHVKCGFAAVYGDRIGLNIKGVKEDPDRNEGLAHANGHSFLKKFNEKININKIIKDFIIEVNTENNEFIINEDFYKWYGGSQLPGDFMYDEDTVYPKYFSKPRSPISAIYITENQAIEVFRKLKYIQ